MISDTVAQAQINSRNKSLHDIINRNILTITSMHWIAILDTHGDSAKPLLDMLAPHEPGFLCRRIFRIPERETPFDTTSPNYADDMLEYVRRQGCFGVVAQVKQMRRYYFDDTDVESNFRCASDDLHTFMVYAETLDGLGGAIKRVSDSFIRRDFANARRAKAA